MHFLITAGGTREYIDPVRFISNASSGKTGYALTRAATEAGHKVTLISASDLQPPVGVDFVGVDSAAEMFSAVKQFFPECDCLVMSAAVSDYTPVKKSKVKMKKSNRELTIKLKPTVDILSWAGKHKNDSRLSAGASAKAEFTNHDSRIVVGFALEDKDLKSRAEEKLKSKNLDMIVADSPEAIGDDKSTVQIKTPKSGWTEIKNADKTAIAEKILRQIEKMLA